MAAYSMDLRTRVLRDADAGLPSKELAAKYPKQWKQYIMRTRTTGRLGPRPPRRSNAP